MDDEEVNGAAIGLENEDDDPDEQKDQIGLPPHRTSHPSLERHHHAEFEDLVDRDARELKQSTSNPYDMNRSHVCSTSEWSVQDVQMLLKYAGLASICQQFYDQQVDGLALLELTNPEVELDQNTYCQLGLDINSNDFKVLMSLVRVLSKMKHKCEVATVISHESISACFRELEINYDDLDFEYECGRGGYGEVYKANWMHRGVACKVFKTRDGSVTPGGTLSKDFWLELNALAKLRHPNITLLLGVCLSPRYCIVTEFVSCGSLFDLIHRHRELPNWGVARIIGVSREICVGMSYLHSQGVLHCDLKSSNILITESWGVKIADFGLSFLFPDSEDGSSGTEHDTSRVPLGCVGTHHWIAPEVLRGEEYSQAADIYSFGIILWEMIHRKIPYHDLTAAQVIALVGYGGKRLRVSSYCPSQVKNIIYKCLSRDEPRKRPPFMSLSTELNGLHRLAVLEVEDNLDSFFGKVSRSDNELLKFDNSMLCDRNRHKRR
jgi:hypothetical protein